MKRFFSHLFGTKTTKTTKVRKSGFKPTMEALEDRQLMAAYINAGTLVIDGQDLRNDDVTVSIQSLTKTGQQVVVSVAGEGTYTFNRSSITTGEIAFYGRAGNDIFRNNTGLAATAFGGFGDDTLIGGSGSDRLEGQMGNDTLEGRGGSDNLVGGWENDTYIFESGSYQGVDQVFENANEGIDTLDFSRCSMGVRVNLADTAEQTANVNLFFKLVGASGESAIDKVIGSNFDDTILGNGLANTINGGEGSDRIEGRSGNDTLFGDNGNDRLFGDRGNDQLFGGQGDDDLFGDAGFDILHGGANNDVLLGGLDGVRDELWGDSGSDAFSQADNDHRMDEDGNSYWYWNGYGFSWHQAEDYQGKAFVSSDDLFTWSPIYRRTIR